VLCTLATTRLATQVGVQRHVRRHTSELEMNSWKPESRIRFSWHLLEVQPISCQFRCAPQRCAPFTNPETESGAKCHGTCSASCETVTMLLRLSL
jgi:hypothetical protein